MSIKNVILAGATGSVGAPILKALLAEPSLNVTILTRVTSHAKIAENIPVKKVSDAFTVEELTEAFRGQDAVVIALTTLAVSQGGLGARLVDAAVAAGVKRYIPSEFGTNNLDPRARRLVPVYEAKGRDLEYLQKRAVETNGRLTWTSISCGLWLDWALDPSRSGNFLGIDVRTRTAPIYDSGLSRLSVTSSTNTGLAVAKVLLRPSDTVNKQIFLSDFVTNSREIIASLEKQLGEKFVVEEKDSASELKNCRAKIEAGDWKAVVPLLKISFVADVDAALDFEQEQEIWNERLGLPKVDMDVIAKEAIELANRA